MCKWCLKHAQGFEYWYLNPKNYEPPEDKSRLELTRELLGHFEEYVTTRVIDGKIVKVLENHYGQVVPIEDVEKIMKMVEKVCGTIVQGLCLCRKVYGGEYAPYCFSWGLPVTISKEVGYHVKLPPEARSKIKLPIPADEAIEEIRKLEEEQGLVHSVYTMADGFIGAVCNCEWPYCIGMKVRFVKGVKEAFLKSHYVAVVDHDRCVGCGKCVLKCQFGALRVSKAKEKAYVNPINCFGCGVCRGACENGAIKLVKREAIEAVKDRW